MLSLGPMPSVLRLAPPIPRKGQRPATRWFHTQMNGIYADIASGRRHTHTRENARRLRQLQKGESS